MIRRPPRSTQRGSSAASDVYKRQDMLYFPLIDTVWPTWMPFVGGERFLFFAPIFNFADICVTVGAIYLLIFQYSFFMREDAPRTKDKNAAAE